MHETGVCRDIVETVEMSALAGHAKKVVEVRLKLGEVHDVVPEILSGAFGWMSRGTVAEGARLVIERVPFTVQCEDCGHIFRLDTADERTWRCPECASRNYRLHTGREFLIDTIEVEGYAAGEQDVSQELLATLRAERAARVPKESLSVSGRRAVGRDDVARAAQRRRCGTEAATNESAIQR